MRRIAIEHVQPGMRLGTSIYNARGDVMLQHHVTLTERMVSALKQHGYTSVYVTDAEAAHTGTDDGLTLSEPTQARLTQKMQTIFEQLGLATANMRQLPLPKIVERVEKGEVRKAVMQVFNSVDLLTEVGNVVDELARVRLLTGFNSIKTYNTYTFQHSIEVMVTATVLGKAMGLTPAQLRQLACGCVLHDIGKIFIDKRILDKPGQLTDSEWVEMRRHPELGYHLLKSLGLGEWQMVSFHIAYQHHEKQDGSGYPRGLKGLNTIRRSADQERGHILLMAEICSVADVFDALISDRPYRAGMSPEAALGVIVQEAGAYLNRDIVHELLKVAPPFPVGSRVIVRNGALDGHQATVVAILPQAPARPVIRLLYDAAGHKVSAADISLTDEPKIELTTAPL